MAGWTRCCVGVFLRGVGVFNLGWREVAVVVVVVIVIVVVTRLRDPRG